jgi:hypothetical protein
MRAEEAVSALAISVLATWALAISATSPGGSP